MQAHDYDLYQSRFEDGYSIREDHPLKASQSRVREVALLVKALYRKLIRQAKDGWKTAEDRSSKSWRISRSIGHDDERLNADVHERMLVPWYRDTH